MAKANRSTCSPSFPSIYRGSLEGLLLLEKKASDLGVLEGSPTPVTSGSDKVMFGIKVIDAPAINGVGPSPFAY